MRPEVNNRVTHPLNAAAVKLAEQEVLMRTPPVKLAALDCSSSWMLEIVAKFKVI